MSLRLLIALIGTLILTGLADVTAQDRSDRADQELHLDEIPIQKRLVPYNNPLGQIEVDITSISLPGEAPDFHEKEILRRITDIYRMHIRSVEYLMEEDLVQAEGQLREGLAAIQSLMDDYPEVQNQRRFTELYRSVMTEYKEFYGISEPFSQVEGEIFAIQEELFNGTDDWMVEGYEMPDNLSLSTTSVPLAQNRHVSRHLVYYTLRRPEVMETWLERSEYYFPMMREIFREEGAPEELIHLSMIESGLVPTARSWAAAVGLWQFIQATGSMYGLEVNYWIDERRDPVKSTRAAARHLRDLYNIWGDWHLAMANYNISPRGLRRAINAAGGVEDYWSAFPFLPAETRGYVPGFIAATTIAMNPEEFGFQRNYGGESYQYEVVEVEGLMPLDKLAEAAGLTVQQLKDYNPELLRWATPPGESYPLKLPAGVRDDFIAAYEQIPREEMARDIAMHTVSSGETLGFIANRYGTTVQALFSTNENLSTVIHPGQRIMVPVASGSMERILADQPSNSPSASPVASTQQAARQAQQPPNTAAVTYRVKSGDTIGHIAEWYDVRAWQIRGWNSIQNTIFPSQSLTIYVPANRASFYRQIDELTFTQKQDLQRRQRQGENIYGLQLTSASQSAPEPNGEVVNYTVQRNDTLIHISQRFGVSVSDIQQWNDLSSARIYAGQTLIIQQSE
ncbi:MAG: LysM peptidoglycan-binding domain-containing protein [Balneolaceae bacterium]